MAKNKWKGQKPRNVFHIASQKNFKGKSKAKPVTTNLKKINIVNAEKVKRMNEAFVDIQKELAHFSQGLSLEPLQKQLVRRAFPFNKLEPNNLTPEFPQPALQPSQENRPVNVDEATRLLAQL